jgi:hypothetical protein
VLEEGISDLFIIGATTDIKEINSNWFIVYVNFLNTVVDTDGCNVLTDKFSLTVAFYDTGFSCFGITDGDELD